MHPQKNGCYADGTIVPIKSYKGGQFTQAEINDYFASQTIRVDCYKGNYPAVCIKFDPDHMTPGVYSSNPDALQRSTTSQSQGAGIILSSSSFRREDKGDQGFGIGSDGISDDFKLG